MVDVMVLVSNKVLPSWTWWKVHMCLNNRGEIDPDSVSVSSAEPKDVEDLEQLANDVFGEKCEMNTMISIDFTMMVRQVFGDFDDE